MLQDIGSGVRVYGHADAWVIALFSYWVDDGDTRWVIDDVRYPNEAAAVKARGGIVIRLNGDPGLTAAQSTRDPAHPSETALDDYTEFDVIINSGDFVGAMDAMCDEIDRQLLTVMPK